MVSLLSLPPEIRTIILDYAITTPPAPPKDPWTGHESRKPCRAIRYNSWDFGPIHTLYAPGPLCLPSTTYKLVSRQLHAETTSVQRRLTPRYDLDVMVVHAWDLWATWTNVPVWKTLAEEVRVTFRLFGHCALPAWLASLAGDGGSVGMEWCFYTLLERFLVLGPVNQLPDDDGPGRERRSERRFFARTLTLNIESHADETKYPLPPPDITYGTYREYRQLPRIYRRRKPPIDLSGYAVRPEWFARTLCSEIRYMLVMSYATLYLGGILYEHIGAIRVLVDGEIYEEFDLAAMLAPMKWDCGTATTSRETRREYFWRWKREALRRRERVGFKVVGGEDEEFGEYPE